MKPGVRGAVFDADSARRVARVVRTVEGGGISSGGATVTSAGDDSDGVLCKTTSAWAKGATATLQIWAGPPGSEANTGCTLTAYNRYAAIATGKWCTVLLHRHGYYYVIAAEC